MGFGLGVAFDVVVDAYKKKNCTCNSDFGKAAKAAGNGMLGAANGYYGDFDQKPRGGIAAGGPAGDKTSTASKDIGAREAAGEITKAERRVLRDRARFVSKRLPYVSAAVAALEIYDAFSCD